jgi:hypothetical protein
VREAELTNETDRVWDFNETKLTTLIETVVQQMCDARWTFEVESREPIVFSETRCAENSDLTTNTKSFGSAQISNQFPTISTHQAIFVNQKVVTVYNKWETFGTRIETFAVDEFD